MKAISSDCTDTAFGQNENAINPFSQPQIFRKLILDRVRMKSQIKFEGKGFICALITARCHIGCSHCMFASNMSEKKNAFNTMPYERVTKLMKLVTDSNTGYLLISGGGEGFLEPNLMYQIAEESTASITWLVTSAFWGKSEVTARKILERLYGAYLKGCEKTPNRRVCVRVSFDTHHFTKLADATSGRFRYIVNLINIFETYYSHQTGFFLQIHSIEGDDCLIEELLQNINATSFSSNLSIHTNEKMTEASITIMMPSGYTFEITFAKLLLSDIEVDLRDTSLLDERIHRWEKDAYVNEKGFTAYQFNSDGTVGTDMLVIYDGRVAGGWQSEMPDVSINLDTDVYQDIMDKTLSDPGVLATIERGLAYRFDIVDEVCIKASIRAKAVNIRDYTSPILLEEDTIKLYYTVRVLQDYLIEGKIDMAETKLWPANLYKLVGMSKEELQTLYRQSKYDIVKQFEDTDLGFSVFSNAIRLFSQNGDKEYLISTINEITKQDKRKIDKWRLLLKRILHDWYDIESWNEQELACLPNVEYLLDNRLLKGIRIYEGLSRIPAASMKE